MPSRRRKACTSTKAWSCFEQRLLRNRPAALVAADLNLKPRAVYVYACRVLKQVRALCEQFDEDISEALEPDMPDRAYLPNNKE